MKTRQNQNLEKRVILNGFYYLSTMNIAISNQPHSEVAALAVILDRIFSGHQLGMKFDNAKLKIVPEKQGKKVIYDS